MRSLSIERKKTFVACAIKMKVYIEDASSNELVIGGVACRKLGDVKNGETKIFQISDNAAKVFVIVDTLSKEYCNEFYQIPEGGEDIFLTGKNHFNPMAGNPFRFDNNDNPAVMKNRQKGKRLGTIVMICAIAVGFTVGFLIGIGIL